MAGNALSTSLVYEMAVKGTAFGQAIVNVLHYRVEMVAGNLDGDMEDLLDRFAERWVSQVMPALSSSYSVSQYELREIVGGHARVPLEGGGFTPGTPDYGAVFPKNGNPAVTGGRAAQINSTFDAITVRKVAQNSSRNYRGGARLGVLADTDVLNNVLATGFLTLADTAAAFLKETFTLTAPKIGSVVPVVFSRTLNGSELVGHLNPGQYVSPIVQTLYSVFVSSQVSRKGRRTDQQ